MGRSKDQFMEYRQAETFADSLLTDDAVSYQTDLQAGLRALPERFLHDVGQYEAGNKSAIDTAVKFKQEMQELEAAVEMRKAWLNENADEISHEAEQYGKAGYKGLVFTKGSKTTYDYKHIPAWLNLKTDLQTIEKNAKLALQMAEKGIEPLDANTGELLPIPEVKVTKFLKTEKSK